MHHRTYEFLATDHIDRLRREAEAMHLAAAVESRCGTRTARLLAGWTHVRRVAAGAISVGRRTPLHVTRPRRDLGAP